MKNLVIVESPAKAKTLESFLGKDYTVTSCYGHIADLPSSGIGVDLETFQPNYVVSEDKITVVRNLKTMANKADLVWLASDEDREGEAIAWHLYNQLGLSDANTKRIVFNSITKAAVLGAIKSPKKINTNLVNAQQARRVLDRLVGYELSPVLWKKIKTGLSAGRVQSVSVRLIVEREREIENSESLSFFKVSAEFTTRKGEKFKAELARTIANKKDALVFLEVNKNATFSVKEVEVKPGKRTPSAPFTTSTLQQEASRKLSFSVSKTMRVAQQLYESGLITYMRTDSVNLSEEAIVSAKQAIVNIYGESYSKERRFATKSKGAQEAHEAIRPTDMSRASISTLERDQQRLYELVWKRSIASQMSDAQLTHTTAKIEASTHRELFVAKGEVITFEGFLKVYNESTDEDSQAETHEGMLAELNPKDTLNLQRMVALERFTTPPPRYTESSLVKKLEELGIGRPSTYAPTISTIQNRGYVEQGTFEGKPRQYKQLVLQQNSIETNTLKEVTGSSKGKLVPSPIGKIVNDFLVGHFAQILDYNFTAEIEKKFDEIAEGRENWVSMMKAFYKEFHPNVEHVEKTAERERGERIFGVDPKTKKQLSVRLGKYGAMAQLGTSDDEDVRYSSLLPGQSLERITFEEAIKLFELPKKIGVYKGSEVEVNSGRYGPYVKHEGLSVSLARGEDIFSVTLDRAIQVIEEKQQANKPISFYEGTPVTKGKGRFGPFIKWNDMYVNIGKNYNFDNLSEADVSQLISSKIKKEAEKVVKSWPEEGITIEKARWGRHHIINGKKKIEVAKDVDVYSLTLEQIKTYFTKKKKK